MKTALALACLGLGAIASCQCAKSSDSAGDPQTKTPEKTAEIKAPGPPKPAPRLELIGALPDCDLEHRGLLLDAGTDALAGRFGFRGGIPEGVLQTEHDGSTWIRVFDKTLTLSFMLTEPNQVFVSARAIGRSAKSASVLLDDQPLGLLNFQRDQIRTANTVTTTLPADAGLHTITLRFAGKPKGNEAFAELDWIRIGFPDELKQTYGPPTMRDVVLPAAALSGVPHRSIALRAPGAVRCPVHLPREARFKASLGLLGQGEGDAEIRILEDGKAPRVLHRAHLTGGDKAVWSDIDVALQGEVGMLAALELRAVGAPAGTRVLLGDPRLEMTESPIAPLPPAKAAIIVVLSGVERSMLPPWKSEPSPDLPALSELAHSATTFSFHRAPTTVVAGVMASLLTGLPPPAHSLTDVAARLSKAHSTIGTVARDASVRTAMFSGVPSTFRAFGFAGTSWEQFSEISPASGEPATSPIDKATSWISDVLRDSPDARLLTVIHARGAHPPWGVSPKEMTDLPPKDYAGPIEPRRAAQVLAELRAKRGTNSLSPADLQRIRALAELALSNQDRALGSLFTALRATGLWDNCLLIVTADISSGPMENSLYAEGVDLRESTLSLPLYVRFPGGSFGGSRIDEPTEVVDLAQTVLASLSLSFSRKSYGRDLALVASGATAGGFSGPQIAVLDDRYSTRWHGLILTGRYETAPFLCDVNADPGCVFNRRDAMPIATSALFRRMVKIGMQSRAPLSAREPATLDQETASALSVWGAAP